MPIAIVSVTNDLTTDQRVDRTCCTLVKLGYEVVLVGRRVTSSKPLKPRSYRMHRMRLLFDSGPLFYAEYNLALFFYLLAHPFDLLISNDSDTLPASFLASRILRRSTRHLHDCHEYFRGVPELVGRKFVTKVWTWTEDLIFPRLRLVCAVNRSVADLYNAEYGNSIAVIRNVPFRKSVADDIEMPSLRTTPNEKLILYQGAVNVGRGLEEAIMAMKFMKTNARLVIAGVGDISQKLTDITLKEGLSGKVTFLGQVPFQDLYAYTRTADIGLSIEKDVSINYHFCLPNKFLDYIQANIPVLVSPFPEMKVIVEHYRIGNFIRSHEPEELAAQLDEMLNNPGKLSEFRQNLLVAAEELCWENEEKILINLLKQS